MMFHADITLVLALIALASGALLILMTKTHKDITSIICKIIGIIIAIIAILIVLCSGHSIFKKNMIKHAMMYNMMYQRKMQPRMMQPKIIRSYMYKKMRDMKTPPSRIKQ